jgi:4-methylaminobutanoate oxidase (formaldehyde-forming)
MTAKKQILADPNDIPKTARVVIVGGGIIGCSVAYHLAKLGWKNVVLFEQGKIAGGTTWHAAGLVGRLRASNSMTKINKYSAELYASLETETGHPCGWNQVGSLVIGCSEERITQLRRTAAMAEIFGVEAGMINAGQAKEKFPFIRSEDVLGAVWLPHDGKVIPQEVTFALAKGAYSQGVKIFEGISVFDIIREKGRATGVNTNRGSVHCENVVLCTGMWTRELGLKCGVTIPLYPVEHHYIVSESIDGLNDDLPVGRDADACIYFRSEKDTIVLGAFQKNSKPWLVEKTPANFSFELLKPDWSTFAEPLKAGKWRIPILEKAQFPRFINGPESFTPDNNFIMGEAAELKNLFVAAGFNSLGIASAGGAGKYLAEWIVEGEATMDLWSVDIRRFAPFHNNRTFLRDRVSEVLGLHYQMAWPNREFETGRKLRKSPLHDRLANQGACFGEKMGLERPNWFAPKGVVPVVRYSFKTQNWFKYSQIEHRATRSNVAVFDQSSFSKYIFKGRDVVEILQYLCGNDIDVPIGKIVYTGMFNKRGTFESDLTVLRLSENEFYIVTSSAQTRHDFDWIERHIPEDAKATLADMTSAYAVLGVMGPSSRKLLSRVTDCDLSNEAFPFGTSQIISIGQATVLAVRITYVGELGWELHMPSDFCLNVYDTLKDAGQSLGVQDAGHYAINSLRLEKGYGAWGAELTPDDTPVEAGLNFAVAWKKPIPFLGREALLAQKDGILTKRLVTFVLQEPEAMLWGNEPIFGDGKIIGYTTSGAYGHSVGGAIAMGYVNHPHGINPEFIKSTQFEIDVDGRRIPAAANLRSPYDPARKRILI